MAKMLKSVDVFTRVYIGSKRIRFQKKGESIENNSKIKRRKITENT